MRARLVWWARVAVSCAVLTLLIAWVPAGQLWTAATSIPVLFALAVLAAVMAGHVVSALKWWCLLRPHAPVPLGAALRGHFGGLLANLYLPGLAGGDVVRAGWVMRKSPGRIGIGVASLADRLLDCLALLLVAVAGVLFTSVAGPYGFALLVGAGVFTVLTGTIGVLYLLLRGWPTTGLLGRVAEALTVLTRNPLRLGLVLAASMLVQAGFASLCWGLGTAAGIEVPPAAWLAAWPLAKLVALLPVSLGGLGVREAALVFFMQPFGAPAAAVTAVGLLWQGLIMASGLVGTLVILVAREREATA